VFRFDCAARTTASQPMASDRSLAVAASPPDRDHYTDRGGSISNSAATANNLVDVSLAKGELSYFHAFRDSEKWTGYEPEQPPLLSAQNDSEADQPEFRCLLAAEPTVAADSLGTIVDVDLVQRVGEEWLRRRSFALADAAISRALEVANSLNLKVEEQRLARLHAQRCAARRGAHDAAGALEDAAQCVRLWKQWPQGHYLQGQILAGQARFVDADRAFERAASLETDGLTRARILEEKMAIAKHLPWGDDISEERDDSALLRILKRGKMSKDFAEDLSFVGCHCRLHEQSDTDQPGRTLWSSYATQKNVAPEFAMEDEKKEPLKWVLGEDEPLFPLLEPVARKLRAGGEAKVRLCGSGVLARSLPATGPCDAWITLVSLLPACRGPADKEEWDGIQSVADELQRATELFDRTRESLRTGEQVADEVERHARIAERRYERAHAWLQQTWDELCQEDAEQAESLRLSALCGRVQTSLLKHEALVARATGDAATDACTNLSCAVREGRATSLALADVKRAAELAKQAVEFSMRMSAVALHVFGLSAFVQGDAAAAKATFDEALRLEPSPATASIRDALIRLRSLEQSSHAADASARASLARDRLEASAEAGDVLAVEEALRELHEILSVVPYEVAMSLKLGKLAANVQKSPPSDASKALATDLIAQLRKLAMSQGRR